MDLRLKNRVALVAAASREIGYACALELAREGAGVFFCSFLASERASYITGVTLQVEGGSIRSLL